LLLEHRIRVSLVSLLDLGHSGADKMDLLSFFHDRLKVHLREIGITPDVINACLAMPGNDDLVLLVRRARSLSEFLSSTDGQDLLQGYRRANNILVAEERKDGVAYMLAPDQDLASEKSERTLFDALSVAEQSVLLALGDEDLKTAMTALSRLRQPVDDFFENVRVNAKDAIIRRNRLCLLNRIREVICRVAAFSEIVS